MRSRFHRRGDTSRSRRRWRSRSGLQPQRPRLAVSTAIFAAATGLSRVLGLVREVISSYYFGATGKVNAFTVAFQLPNLVRALVADAALSSAFVPVFSELLEKGERKRAWRVASTLFWLMLLGLTGLTVVFILIAPSVIGLCRQPRSRQGARRGTLARAVPDRDPCSAFPESSSGSSTRTSTSLCLRSRPSSGTLAIIVGLAIGVPQAHTRTRSSTSTQSRSSSRRSFRSFCRSPGCVAATVGSSSCSTGATRRSSASSC